MKRRILVGLGAALLLVACPVLAEDDVKPALPAAADRVEAEPDVGAGRNPFAAVEGGLVPLDYLLATSRMRLSALVAVAGHRIALVELPDEAGAGGNGLRFEQVTTGDWLNLRLGGRDYRFRVAIVGSEVRLLAESGEKYGLCP